ncbi:MAG: DNA polymerase I, partial [Alphaproteobacteria bacterium]|nr:DNA polymerase I [Alphaproteobacteria bacterium]
MATEAPAGGRRHRVYLVDGSGYIFRAYHALPPRQRGDGMPVGAVFGFCNMLYKLIEDMLSDGTVSHAAVIFDAGRHTFRNDIYPEYKANRPEAPEDLVPQFPLFRDAVRAFNLPCIEQDGFEADDLIASYARAAREQGAEVVIISSDKDLMQLVNDDVGMRDPIRDRPIGQAEVMEKFGVPPSKVVDVQALAGDSTDNVPGVPGIGIKTAAQLINEYGDLDTLLARAGEIKQPKRRESLLGHAEAARISRELVRLKDDVPLSHGLDDLAFRAPQPETLLGFLKEMEFHRLRERAQARFASGEPVVDDGLLPEGERATPEPEQAAPAYELVQELPALDRWIARARAAGQLAVDTETTSLDTMRADLVGISLALAPGDACYIPLAHKGRPAQGALALEGETAGEAPPQIPAAEALARLKPLLEDPAVLKVGQNIKYDAQIFARLGIDIAPVDDTMLLSFVLDNGLHGHGMDELSELHLGHKTISFAEVAGSGKSQVTFDHVPLERALAYAAEDADVTLRLHRLLRPRLLAQRMVSVYETLERPLIPVLRAMEAEGVRIDVDVLRELSADFARRMVELEGEIHRLAGEEFNIGSPKQLGEILFEKMSLGGGRKGKTGAWGTGADVLEELAAQGHDLPARVLDWRQLSKLKSTYTDALQTQINPRTGRVHTTYAQAATSTGRLASSDPNLQNIPVRTEDGRKIRRAFVADPGWKLLSADYSQIELRLLAHIADIGALKEAFAKGIDIHALTASQVFDLPIEGMDPMVRRSAKAINFGIIYGMSSFGLAQQLGIPQGEAKRYIDAYFARYPGIRDYMERTKEQARASGHVTTIFGRRCHFPGIRDKNPARRNFQERAAINAPIQGSAADIIKRAMIRMP